MMNLHTAVGWQGWQRKRKQQDVQYTLLFANHQVSAATTSKKQSCTGACRSGTLPCRLLGSERAVQKTEAQLAGGWEPEAMDCHWSREACSKLLGTSSDVCLRDLSTLAALFVGIQAAKTVALSPGELHAPPMAGGIRQSFGKEQVAHPLQKHSLGDMRSLGRTAVVAGLKAVELQTAAAFAFLSVDILWVFLEASDGCNFPRTCTLLLQLLRNFLESCMKSGSLETLQSHSAFLFPPSVKEPITSTGANHSQVMTFLPTKALWDCLGHKFNDLRILVVPFS